MDTVRFEILGLDSNVTVANNDPIKSLGDLQLALIGGGIAELVAA